MSNSGSPAPGPTPSVLPALAAGLLTVLSLIVAIGAQNAFVLRQGLRRDRVALVVAICALSDVVLIFAGVAGIGAVVERAPLALAPTRCPGARARPRPPGHAHGQPGAMPVHFHR